MQEEKNTKAFSAAEVIIFVGISLIIGLLIGSLINKNRVLQKVDKANSDKYLQEFTENYNYIVNNYYEKLDKEKLINSAIAGMMDSLDDPYSVYFDKEETENLFIILDGSYEGIGVQISKEEETGYMLIVSVFKNSSAFQAGLKVGDEITALNGASVSDTSSSEFSSSIRNSKDTSFELSILRDSKEMSVTLNKGSVTLDSILSKTYDINGKKIGYIYIGIFANNTESQFKEALKELESSNINSLIIDVRGNSGGHLTAVDGILESFLNSKQIKYQFEQGGEKSSIYASGKNKKYNIILLGDENSASASEVLISSLHENLNSVFIGKKTYGKGTVQELITLSDGTQYKITTKKWLTPKGNWINDTEGIEPDIEVELDDKYYETYLDEDDTQLQAALDYLKQ